MLTGRRYRLKLTPEQAESCTGYANICRFVWNSALEQRREYRRKGVWTNYVPQARELSEAKREPGLEWLAAAPSHVLQQTLRDLDRACREHGTFAVRWRSKHRWAPSLRFPDPKPMAVQRINRKWGRVKLPKLGWVTYRSTRPLIGAVKSATVAQKAGQWWISFLIDDGRTTPEQHANPGAATGIDRGVAYAAVTSDGEFHDRSFSTPGEAKRYKRLQQQLARQKKGSASRGRTLARLRRLSCRISDRRGDFAAQLANHLATDNAVVVLEDLKTRNMTARARDRNVAAKSGLNRAILDKGWHRLELALSSRARYTGTELVKVNPAYTSQTCHACGHLAAENRESQSVFRCKDCGHHANADVNAAKNILKAAGLAVSACGDLGVGRSAKQEPGESARTPHQPGSPVGIPRPLAAGRKSTSRPPPTPRPSSRTPAVSSRRFTSTPPSTTLSTCCPPSERARELSWSN
ncbi:RNA-guided endonuclease InsQ/TnpB family protein [Salininema proteolyticum]|uniref:RNA-guided endonuclease InsQ/TnpB family protein n=1 Tax=Salininema proteolyticum TaxID=1607685 RepID=A0ABV8U0E5_9ACTN